MSLNRLCNDININHSDKKYLILLSFFSILLMFFMIQFHQTRGAFNPDIYAYLAGSLELAGLNSNHLLGGFWIQNSPVIIFFTSLLFRMGFVNINSIFVVTGIFGIFGIFGMYTFLKIRFSNLLSFLGAILYSSLSLSLYYFANGMLDVPAVSMILWTLIFTVAAVDKNYKYYLLVAIMFCVSFFTRFATAYILSIIVLYILKNHDLVNLFESLFHDRTAFKMKILSFFKSNEFKWIFISTILVVIIFLVIFKLLLGFYPEISYFSMAGGSIKGYSSTVDVNKINDKLFYIKNFLKLLSCNWISFDKNFTEIFNDATPFAYLIMGILFGGIFLKCINYIKNYNFFKVNFKHIEYRNKFSFGILLSIIIILAIVSRFGFKFNYLITLMALWLICIILMSLGRNLPINQDKFSLSIMCFALFSFYLVVVSYVNIKCVRYLLPAFPALIYFVILALDYILEFINTGFDDENSLKEKLKSNNFNYLRNSKSDLRIKLSKVIPIILIVLCLVMVFNFTNTVEINQDGLDRIDFCNFIKEYDDDYQSKSFMGYRELRIFEWYLNKDILKWGEDVTEFNPDDHDYLILEVKKLDDKNYKEVYHKGKYRLYERVY
ncbi:glycosyltransferase family 39 protein [Methanobrevibacter sp. UBA212]|uniref:glycosyltransferase family 39 protein n=1 Tax=Methanobrevibacter sp. UBA212 TaxID=1915476 RepID=UPI0025CD40C0|nr:glycosyltransferase family 39 protein [Methanobrevibacter sp. UBA212]